MRRYLCHKQLGSMLVGILVITSVFVTFSSALLSLIVQQKKLGLKQEAQALALTIAEAGINYYKWHLDNFTDDYTDGNDNSLCDIKPPYTCGPYTHDYEDPGGAAIGKFELFITPPPLGSTIVKIKSTGWTTAYPQVKRMLAVRYGRSSWARYAVVANANMRFGSGTEVHGPIHANGGIRFDGLAYNEITSAVETYNDTDGDACTKNSWGVHTCVDPDDPSPPTLAPKRTDVFIGGRRYPLPMVDFNAVTVDLAGIKQDAKDDGLYLNKSNKQGYHVQFLGNNTVRYKTVNSTTICTYGKSTSPKGDINQYLGNWATVNLPKNGIIFVEDNLWVDGTIPSGSFITLVAAKEPLATGNATVWINNDVLYAAKDGTSGLGIIAQNNISVGLLSEDDLEIDAALLAQKGNIGRNYYPSSCSSTYYKRNTITIYGSIGTNKRYGFSWGCGGVYCSGYKNRNINYDTYMIYSPPPSFPTSGDYSFISWEELLPGETY